MRQYAIRSANRPGLGSRFYAMRRFKEVRRRRRVEVVLRVVCWALRESLLLKYPKGSDTAES